jgi:hypothetical protein
MADAFNLFNPQTVTGYDNYTEVSFQVPNADFGRRLAHQTPFQLRLGKSASCRPPCVSAARASAAASLGRLVGR